MNTTQAYREAKTNTAQYCIGCSSIFFVVFFVALLMTVLSYAPVIFLNISESSVSEVDMNVLPAGRSNAAGLNYTAVQIVMANAATRNDISENEANSYGRHAARYSKAFSSVSATECSYFDNAKPEDSQLFYTGPEILPGDNDSIFLTKNTTRQDCSKDYEDCLKLLCGKDMSITLTLLDTERETELEIGRKWSHPPPPKGAVIIQDGLAYSLGVSAGDYVVLRIDFLSEFEGIYNATNIMYNATNPAPFATLMPAEEMKTKLKTMYMPAKVYAVFATEGNGKFSTDNRNNVVADLDTFFEDVSKHLHPDIPSEFRQAVVEVSRKKIHYQYTTLAVFSLPSPRTSWYMDTNFKNVAVSITSWASKISFALGFSQCDTTIPILKDLQSSETVSAVLNMVISLGLVVLCSLSIFLVYSLLMVSVETRTFELGVFRMVGMTRSDLIQFLLVQALGYAIPAWIAGLVLAQVAFVPLRDFFGDLFGVTVNPLIVPSGIVLASFLGLVSPLLSAILPIRKALNHNLHDALDTRRGRTKAVMVTLERSMGTRGSPTLNLIGVVLTVFGFGAYYFIPYSLVTSNIGLFFNLLLTVMIGMILGLVIASLNFQPVLERLSVFVIFAVLAMENKAIPQLVVKNLIAHRLRNRKTTIMYALSLGFIIFISVFVQVELKSLTYTQNRKFGSSLRIVASAYNLDGTAASIRRIQTLETYAENEPYIEDYGWMTYALDDLVLDSQSSFLMNPGRIVSFKQKIYGVSPNILELSNPEFVKTTLTDPSVSGMYPRLAEQLYSMKGSRSAILGTYYQAGLQLYSDNFTDTFLVKSAVSSEEQQRNPNAINEDKLVYPLAFTSGLPFFTTSSRTLRSQDMLVSIPQFIELSRGFIKSTDSVPYNKMLIKLTANVTGAATRRIKKDLQRIVSFESVQDLNDQLAGYGSASGTLSWVFSGVTAVAMMLSFFSLNTSMYVNIVEQSKEIGIFRALGARKAAIYRIYTYEAFVLTFSSGVLGVMIGVVVGWTITMQRAMITEVPLAFEFPTQLLAIVFISSAVCAILSTVSPVGRLMNRKLVSILRE